MPYVLNTYEIVIISKFYLVNYNRYNANASSTYRMNGASFYIIYGGGSFAAGHFDNDSVTVSEYEIRKKRKYFV